MRREGKVTMLHRAYEQLMVKASLDPALGALLLVDPCQAALNADCNPMLAESLVGLCADTLADFALALHQRVYGCAPAQSPALQTRQSFETQGVAAYAQ